MKSFIVTLSIVALFAGVQAGEDYLAQGDIVINSCLPTWPVGQDVVDRLKAGVFTDAVTETLQCFVKCFYDTAHFYGPSGEPIDDVIADGLAAPADYARSIASANRCHATTGATDCDKAYQHFKCYKQGF